jgi:ABC-2 type transport system permease protein
MFDDSPQNLGANVSPQENKPKHFDVISSIENDPKAFDNMVMGSMYANCVFLYLVFSIVFASYSLRCLFDDRKNKDILFWRSMPVSETTNVLVKLAMVVVVAPVIMLVLNMLITLLSIFVGFIFFGYFGARISFLLASIAHGQSLFIPFQIFFELLFSLFMLLPVIGFAFFVSALAKKAPFFIFASPALLILADVLLNKFWGLNLGVIDLLQVYVSALVHVKSAFILQESFAIDSSMFLPFIVCIALGALFLAGAIWLRNHRYEI